MFHIYRDWSRSRIKSCNPKNQIWDLSRNKWYLSQSGCGIKSGIHTTFLASNCGSALTRLSREEKRAWCARCMDHFERYWKICAKTACGRVHPVAVVTASSRISRNSRAGWPTVLHQRAPGLAACCCSSRPIIGMDEHWTTLTRAAPVGGARLAIRRASFAISDCWLSPQLRGGLDHTPVSRRCSNISQNGPCTEHTRLCLFFSAKP